MELVIAFLIVLVVLDIVALHRGFDSRVGMDSAEWEHRLNRQHFC